MIFTVLLTIIFFVRNWWFNIAQSKYVHFSGTVEQYMKEPFYLATYVPSKTTLNLTDSCKEINMPNAYLRYLAREHYHFMVYKGIKINTLGKVLELKLPNNCSDRNVQFTKSRSSIMSAQKVGQSFLIDYPSSRNKSGYSEDSIKFYVMLAKNIHDDNKVLIDSITYYRLSK